MRHAAHACWPKPGPPSLPADSRSGRKAKGLAGRPARPFFDRAPRVGFEPTIRRTLTDNAMLSGVHLAFSYLIMLAVSSKTTRAQKTRAHGVLDKAGKVAFSAALTGQQNANSTVGFGRNGNVPANGRHSKDLVSRCLRGYTPVCRVPSSGIRHDPY